MTWVQFGAGSGPRECAWVARQVAERFLAEVPGALLLEATEGSVVVEVPGEVPPGWLGTIQWIGESPFRPGHKRKNWFIDVAAFQPPDEAGFAPGELRWEVMRAGGPGGQHANKTSSAVRVTHAPTGLAAIARDGRSQHQNRKLALARLAEALATRGAQAEADGKRARWGRHQALERGNAVRVYRGPEFRLE
jgi:peptide chain release factor